LKNFQSGTNVLAETVKQINEKLPNSGVTVQHLIEALCGSGKLTIGGKEYPITADFSFAFFADCVNESILMSPIKVE
jgi:hypothetical protein